MPADPNPNPNSDPSPNPDPYLNQVCLLTAAEAEALSLEPAHLAGLPRCTYIEAGETLEAEVCAACSALARDATLAAVTAFTEEPIYIHRIYSAPAAGGAGGGSAPAVGGAAAAADGAAASAAGAGGGGARRSRRSSGGAQITVKGSGGMSVTNLKLLVWQARHPVP